MFEGDSARFIYLILLLLFVGYWFLASHGRRALRHAASWVVIFFAVAAAAGLWGDIRSQLPARIGAQQSVFSDAGRIEVPRARDGHYYLTLKLNGVPVDFVVDTGASDIVLTRDDAKRVGLDPDRLIFSGRAGTANGQVRTARLRVGELSLGPLVDRDVPVWVNEGEMHTSLLGMAYLQRFDSLTIEDNRLVLER